MGERRGTKALELWCRRITEGYPGVNVQNMTTSWRDGLAFCAMIHHFRPDLIDFNILNKDNVLGNNELAFRTAEQHLGIPALLDAEDMASCSVPDRLSILTYLSQFYQTFGGSSPSRLARATDPGDQRIAPVPESPKPKVGSSRLGMRRDPCAACGLPVFLAEKLVVDRAPYHRTCFRCARCNNQLTRGNYYETEGGQYCCETCPDEEEQKPASPREDPLTVTKPRSDEEKEAEESRSSRYRISISDEEKSKVRAGVLDPGKKLGEDAAERNGASLPDLVSQTSKLRLNFMASHLLSERDGSQQQEQHERSMVDGRETDQEVLRRRIIAKDEVDRLGHQSGSEVREEAGMDSAFPDDDTNEEDEDEDEDEEEDEEEDDDEEVDEQSDREEQTIDSSGISAGSSRLAEVPSGSLKLKQEDSEAERRSLEEVEYLRKSRADVRKEDKMRSAANTVHSALDVNLESGRCQRENEDQRLTAISFHDLESSDKYFSVRSVEEDTKEAPSGNGAQETTEKRVSLVQSRLMMFEKQDRAQAAERRDNGRSFAKSDVLQASRNSEVAKPFKVKTFKDSESTLEARKDSKDSEKIVSGATSDTSAVMTSPSEPIVAPITPSWSTRKEAESGIPTNTPPIASSTFLDVTPMVTRDSHDFVSAASESILITAKGIDLSDCENYPDDLNPFKSDEEETPGTMEDSRSTKLSTNPFDSDVDDEETEELVPPKPAARSILGSGRHVEQQADTVPIKRRLPAPQINLNPFWSDEDEEHLSDGETKQSPQGANVPVPKPRTIKNTTPELGVAQRKLILDRKDVYASNSSITSSESATTPGGTYRKKKPAPQPPTTKELFSSDQLTSPVPRSYNDSSIVYRETSPRTTPRTRKTKPAPPPPMSAATILRNLAADSTLSIGEIVVHEVTSDGCESNVWEDQKTSKDETNRNRQSLTSVTSGDNQLYKSFTDKSVQGKWKRKKGPAPPRPLPHRRKIKVMSLKDVKLELDEIELQQQGLERQGVRLEQLIRDKCESGSHTEDSSLTIDVEELVLELFALVNEKNELFRRQAELMLLRRQQRLEEEHAEVEYEIRCLMCQPEATKTDFEKQREEALIQRLVEIVERRNEIVECLEMDRRREVEEDRSIHKHMGLFAARNKSDVIDNNDSCRSSKTKKGKIKEKLKEKKLKKQYKKDADKDVDEAEVKLKRHNKRKWF